MTPALVVIGILVLGLLGLAVDRWYRRHVHLPGVRVKPCSSCYEKLRRKP